METKKHESLYKELMDLVGTIDFGTDETLGTTKHFFKDSVSAMR